MGRCGPNEKYSSDTIADDAKELKCTSGETVTEMVPLKVGSEKRELSKNVCAKVKSKWKQQAEDHSGSSHLTNQSTILLSEAKKLALMKRNELKHSRQTGGEQDAFVSAGKIELQQKSVDDSSRLAVKTNDDMQQKQM